MMYYVSNACVHPGYATFESDDWPPGCAPTKKRLRSARAWRVCGTEGTNYVEEFASCADIFDCRKGTTPFDTGEGLGDGDGDGDDQ